MGVVEALQNLESSRTIASLNGSHSDVRLGRLPMENGECSFHSQSPKLKRRIISAVRDFPPGCGRFAQINNLRPDKEATSVVESVPTETLIRGDKNGDGHGVDKMMLSNGHEDETDLNRKDIDTVETIESVTALEHEISDSPKNLHQLNNLRSVEEAASVGTAEALISRGKNGDGQGIEKPMVSTGQVDETVLMNGKAAGTVDAVESLTALEHEVSDLLKNPNQLGVASPNEDMVAVLPDINVCSPPVSNGNGVDKIAVKKYPPRRRVSAVRDFPLLCGRNVSLEERNFGQERSAVGDKPSSSNTPKTSVKQIGEDFQDDEFHKSDLEVNGSKVIGEVQPNCKENAVQEMEKQDECKLNSKMNVVSKDTKKKCIEPSQERNGCKGAGDVGYSEEKVGKEMVVYHEKEIPSEKCLDECKVNSMIKVVPKDIRKECIEPSQENNGCQGPGDVGHSEELVGKEIVVYHAKESPSEKCLDISNFHSQLHEEDFESSELTSDRVMVMGKESIPICAVNTIDDEKPPPFVYITNMIYPDWCRPIPPKGCSCTVACSDSEKCSCAVNNGGEIPYNFNGAIVEVKPLVYECGPSCKCPPSCYNRVSQRGIKFPLEIFKTESRGWGVRSLNSIPSGSFICEYIGELLEDREAEERTGNDEYLFDIGNNYNDGSLWDGLSTLMPDAQSSSYEVVGDGGFTIDAAQYGNVGRFVNHSCSPNLYAQNVLYDHDDTRIPHIMFFAAENIPPLQELTYHYNYMIDQVRDSDGNIKKKSCYCGSAECTGRLY